ncbi:hypothetical protein RJ639_042965 [Escallonia herrerae]|uniref:Uncharacterized protein n=1 Tax=Escallonia herrerae TaxID=1293975 RepID=A0AA88WCB9_9ASTE|nr:hypothetical protein RJ639_042965 [Escallonia herrerae]
MSRRSARRSVTLEEYTKTIIRVQETYETLSDPQTRASYDIDMSKGLHLAFSAKKKWPKRSDITMATSETNPESGPVNPNVQHSGGTVYAMPYVAPAHGSVGLGERPEKFNGKDFKRWQHKMLFYLTTLNLARFLQEDAPDLGENPNRQTVAAMDAWKHSDFLCKNYILNGLDNALYNVYSPMVNAKALWESLERKYKTEDAGSKKFVVGKFLDFKMVEQFKTSRSLVN